ncbi:HAD superfamily hydrolase [Zostera marina]|uniref:HAD superfamily hydrolase n=1 Tax=Zostera marina TaxID=29655 RepID=A0A0K9PUV7_ZOSMR|nr:HAD superfamily hydrolase [Zostera marina]
MIRLLQLINRSSLTLTSSAYSHNRRRHFITTMAASPPHSYSVAPIRSPTQVTERARLRGVVFDMDGTLTVPVINFAEMYREVLGDEAYKLLRSQNPNESIDILHHIDGLETPEEKKKAYDIIVRFEKQGLDRLQIMPGAADLCRFLDSKNIRRGLVTRNMKNAVDMFHLRFGMVFNPALSREFKPYKPNPAPLLHICSTWGIHPNEIMMIGDSLKDDIVCGKRAGAFTCLLDETDQHDFDDHHHIKPDFKVSSLVQVDSLLKTHFNLGDG